MPGGRVGGDAAANSGIQQIYVSEAARGQQTAQPLSEKLNIRPEVVAAKDVDGLAAKLRSGGTALVVGHSNTLPEILKAIGGGTVKPIDDDEFGLLFVATITGPEHANVVTLRYAACPAAR